MKAFLSYSTTLDQIIALRLQTMAAVYGIASYVPPATTRQFDSPYLSAEVRQRLQESDVVLAIVTHNPSASALSEMNWSVAERKLLIPIISPGVSPEYYANFQPFFVVDPLDPSKAEHQIVQYLAQKQQAQTTNGALVALATLSVALLVLGAVGSDG
jgi:hypothetical protein